MLSILVQSHLCFQITVKLRLGNSKLGGKGKESEADGRLNSPSTLSAGKVVKKNKERGKTGRGKNGKGAERFPRQEERHEDER